MLTKGDDYPIHQTPEPIAYAGTDRNFYDRYFFNGYSTDGSLFFGVAFGIYPHLNIADAHFSVLRDGVQSNLHASRHLNLERMDLEIGPIRIMIEEPLQRLRIRVAPSNGMAADIVFEGRAFPIEEPRFTHRVGPRTLLDMTRMTQNGRYAGWIEVDGVRTELPSGCVGTRDRSWGVRPIGAGDQQPYVPAVSPGFFWQWTPLNFADKSVFFHINADAQGKPWNTRSVIVPDGASSAQFVEPKHAHLDFELRPGTRHPQSGVLTLDMDRQPPLRIQFAPLDRFQMCGLGYLNPKWVHGGHKGSLCVERDDYRLDTLDVNEPSHLHVQAVCRLTLERSGSPTETGIGVFEQLILGPYAPLGLGDTSDAAGAFAKKASMDATSVDSGGHVHVHTLEKDRG